MNINRRNALLGLAASSATAGACATAAAMVPAVPRGVLENYVRLNPADERFRHHLGMMALAANELVPAVIVPDASSRWMLSCAGQDGGRFWFELFRYDRRNAGDPRVPTLEIEDRYSILSSWGSIGA